MQIFPQWFSVSDDQGACGCLGRRGSQRRVQPSTNENVKAKKYANEFSTSNQYEKQEQQGSYSDDDEENTKYDPKYWRINCTRSVIGESS